MEVLDIDVIKKRSIQGVVSLISRKFILQLISLASFVVISTNLSSADIGLYTVVISIQSMISFFSDFGFGAALVQKREEITQEDITTTFTIQSVTTLLIFVLVFLLRGIIGSVFHLRSDAVMLLLALVFTIFISSFKGISSILLERHIKFQKLIIPQIAEALVFNIVLVTLVLKNFGLSSYTYAFLSSSLTGLPIYFLISPWKVRFGVHKTSLHPLKYGFFYQTKNILATIKDDLLIALLPRFITYSQIGYFGFAQKWAFFVYNYVVDSVTRVTFSTYSRIQHETEYMSKAIEKSLLFVSSIMFPVLTGIMITMPYFISFIPKWHDKWEPASVSIVFLCLNAMVSSLSGILVNVLDSTGHVKKTLQLMGIWTLLTWTVTPLAIYFFGYNGVAIASFLITLSIVYTVKLVKQTLHLVKFDLIGSIKKPVIATIIMGVATYSLCRLLVTNIIVLIFVILIAMAIYFTTMFLIAGDEFIQDIKQITRRNK